MSTRPVRGERYGAVAIALHWLIAALIVTNLIIGLRSSAIDGLARFELLQWHKSVGISVLVLTVLRLGWRLSHRPPAYPADLSPTTRAVAATVHWLFYALMLALPLTGWLMVSASPTNIPTLVFQAFPWPHVPVVHDLAMPTRVMLTDRAQLAHVALTYIAYVLIALHVTAALKHRIIDRDGVLARMLPVAAGRPEEN